MRMMKTDKCVNHQFCFLIFLHNENILQLRLVMKFLTMVSSSFLQQQIPARKDTKLIMISFINQYVLFKPTCNTCETSWFLHSLETFSPDKTLTLNQCVHPLLRASTRLSYRKGKKVQGYENLSFHTARAIFFSVTTDCNVSRILAHVSSKFTMRGLSDIFHRRTKHGFRKI